MDCRDPITTAGFWIGTLLPLVHLPLLASGVETVFQLFVLCVLLVGNIVALIIGHDYRRSR